MVIRLISKLKDMGEIFTIIWGQVVYFIIEEFIV